ncbi:MAG: hypothetical protein WBR26_05610 [Candidatus Acidiferrum sp.]
MQESISFSEEELTLPRVCEICGRTYTLEEAGEHFFSRPYNYRNGCAATCLTCWLDCGPPRDRNLTGNLLREFAAKLSPDAHLVVMPVHRLMFSEPIEFQSGSIIYPSGLAKLVALKLGMNKEVSTSLSFYQSAATFVDKETFSQAPTVAFTYKFDWDGLWHGSHKSHMEFIRIFSQIADVKCLNWIRYKFCAIDIPDVLPSRAGQTRKDPTMSAALLYNAFRREGGIIAGDAFNSVLTRGLGLPLNEDDIAYNDFPDLEGEVGNIALHALDLYSAILQAEYPTAQFTQLMALLEFLADPTDYTKSHEVGKIIGRYVATNEVEYEQFKGRYHELSGKKDDATGEYVGYRTRIVHMGARLESILAAGPRSQLLKELDGYVRTVIDHMIERSSWSYDSYLAHRESMKPFLK